MSLNFYSLDCEIKMGKLISVKKMMTLVQQKNLNIRRLNESNLSQKNRSMPTFSFAAEIRKSTGEQENRAMDRFAGQF